MSSQAFRFYCWLYGQSYHAHPYRPITACRDLSCTKRSLKRWMKELVSVGYLHTDDGTITILPQPSRAG